MKIGFALIPSNPILTTLITTQNHLVPSCHFQDNLDANQNLPHLTLFQGDMRDNIPYRTIADSLFEQYENEPFLLRTKSIKYVPQGWYFLMLKSNSDLTLLHYSCVYFCYSYLTFSDQKEQLDHLQQDQLTKQQIHSILNYSYRYVGNAYAPHITIGRNVEEYPPILLTQCQSAFQSFPTSFYPGQLTVYQMGDNGAYEETLYSKTLYHPQLVS